MNDNLPRWTLVEFPQPVADDEIPWSRFLIVDDDRVVAEVTTQIRDHGEEIVFRLNKLDYYEWREHERAREEQS